MGAANSKLLDAAWSGDVEAVRELLQRKDINIETKDMHLQTPLNRASAYGRADVVALLLAAGAKVDTEDKYGYTPLLLACQGSRSFPTASNVVSLLLDAGANPNQANKDGRTPLYGSMWYDPHPTVLKALLAAGADVNLATKDGRTPLHEAVASATKYKNKGKEVDVVKLLLAAGANPNAPDSLGRTPLHVAVIGEIALLLLDAQADPNVVNNNGETPLHNACRWRLTGVVNVLVNRGANVNAEDKNGDRPLHILIQEDLSGDSLTIMKILVPWGASWDDRCDLIVDESTQTDHMTEKWVRHGPALRVCVHMWTKELAKGIPLTEIPIEVVENGAVATQTFIDEIASSKHVVFRRKICVVGPSNWGKTSLIKLLTANKPSLVHADDRTIGIDHFSLSFDQKIPEMNRTKRHEVTFWDFAGQDEYQVAHSLFFSARTLFLVCVDLESCAIAHMQAELMTDYASEADTFLNEFVDRNILRWIRLIFARQPDAEFVFVATKKYRLLETHQELLPLDETVAVVDLKKRLANVMAIVEDMTRELNGKRGDDDNGGAGSRSSDPFRHGLTSLSPITHLKDPRLHDREKLPIQIVISSSTRSQFVNEARKDVMDVILKSDRGFPMPDKYSLVLSEIVRMRTVAAATTTDVRVQDTFVDVQKLTRTLQSVVRDPAGETKKSSCSSSPYDEPYVDESTCRIILETLRDLGDVLWYDKISGNHKLKTTVMLDPLLLIDFVRQVITHKLAMETMAHATLSGLPFWKNLDQAGVLSMKRVLQHFHLVLPTAGDMRWDSDLLVPAYWKSNTCAFWMFAGDDLRLSSGIHTEQAAVRVHWELHFVTTFPDSLFDHVVVASYSPTGSNRSVGPDWILYRENEGTWACRLVVGRDPTTHVRTLHLEALVGAGDVAPEDQDELWAAFQALCDALALVLRGFPGLSMMSCARDGRGGKPSLRSLTTLAGRSHQWLPPAIVHVKCRDLLTASQ